MLKEYKVVDHHNGYTIAKYGEIGDMFNGLYAIFESDLVNAVRPSYAYFGSIKECKEFISNML